MLNSVHIIKIIKELNLDNKISIKSNLYNTQEIGIKASFYKSNVKNKGDFFILEIIKDKIYTLLNQLLGGYKFINIDSENIDIQIEGEEILMYKIIFHMELIK